MDEQSHDSELSTRSPEQAPEQPESFLQLGDPPKEKPLGLGSAALLVGVGALVIIGIFAVLVSVNPNLNPTAQPIETATVPGQEFAAVRQKADAAFQQAQGLYAQGKYDEALILLDQAIMNDPDKRADIQELLQKDIQAIRERDAARAPVVAGSPVISGPAPTVGALAGFDVYAEAAAGIAMLYPQDWGKVTSPQSEIGQGIVQFTDPTGEARFTVARDEPQGSMSPELYAATLETRMRSLPGYASEQVQLTNVGGLPAVKRTFSLTGKSPSGKENTVRALQTVVGHGRTMYILTGESGASKFENFKSQFQTMTDSFRIR